MRAWALGILLGLGSAAWGQGGDQGTEMRYERDWAQQAVPFFRVVLRADGSGTFGTERTAAEGAAAPIHVSQRTWGRVMAAAGTVEGGRCETGNKHLAQTGRKVLTVVRGGKTAACTFNFSEDKHVQEAVEVFSGVATTMEERPVLEHLRRYDRLGLDAELGSFLESARAGRAIELGNLAPLLRELAGDEVLMERVRGRAATLLGMAEAGS